MHILFCGVRGSTPSPGADFVRYGGNTSCVAVAHDGEDPSLVLDAGTGLQRLSRHLGGRPFRGTILLGHLHWDHTHGLPFFPAGDNPDSDVTVLIPAQGDAERVLERAISPPHFPVTPSQLRGQWRFASLEPGHHHIEGFDVVATDIPHKGGRTFGFRVSEAPGPAGPVTASVAAAPPGPAGPVTASVAAAPPGPAGPVTASVAAAPPGPAGPGLAYLSDHWPIALADGDDGLGPYHEAAMALAGSVDTLIHDAQYTRAELAARRSFGHSAVEYAVGLAEAAGARRLVLFHHDPSRTDDQIDALVASQRGRGVEVVAAFEGMTLDL